MGLNIRVCWFTTQLVNLRFILTWAWCWSLMWVAALLSQQKNEMISDPYICDGLWLTLGCNSSMGWYLRMIILCQINLRNSDKSIKISNKFHTIAVIPHTQLSTLGFSISGLRPTFGSREICLGLQRNFSNGREAELCPSLAVFIHITINWQTHHIKIVALV